MENGFSADQPVRIGIPFVMYVAGGVLHLNAFLWNGLFGNLIVVIAVGFGLGLVFRLIERKVFSNSNSLHVIITI